jgi:putative tryptophan/tyrosine transport system substrate-binding protein
MRTGTGPHGPGKDLSRLKAVALIAPRSVLALALCAVPFALCASAHAQQPAKLPRIGFLGSNAAASSARIDGFRQGLRALGYVEGKNIVIEYGFEEEKLDRQNALVTELVRHKVDIIVTAGAGATRAAKAATSTIPIVMSQDPDPVGNGFVASLARPGGNITGLSSLGADLAGKRLELLKEILPKLSRVAVFITSTNPGNAPALRETKLAAEAFKIQLQILDVLGPKDIEDAFQAAKKGRAEAFVVQNSPVSASHRKEIAALAAKSRLPAFYNRSDYVEDGGLMSYGVSFTDLAYRAATYVDKILKGAKPADLPVEQPKKFELLINLKAAKQIGLAIPPNVLARADKVIK